MKISFQRESFLAAFQIAASVAPRSSPKPILQNVKIEVSQEGTTLLATDMEVGVRVNVPEVEVEQEGAALLPVARFGPILRESSDEVLNIEASAEAAKVRGARSEFQLPGESPEEFPRVQEFAESAYHEVDARLLKELIRRTIFATDTESGRFALGGVLLEMGAEEIVAVGTDGRRLAKMQGPAKSVGDHQTGDSTTIVPTRAMHLIERALSDQEELVKVAARANDIMVQTPRATVFSRLVEGRFPRWRDVFPERTGAVSVDMTVGPLYAAVRQASVVSSDESRGLDLQMGEGTLVLSGATAEVGQSRVELPIPYEGDLLAVTLDHRYLGDFLKVLSTDATFALEIEDAESAAVFTAGESYAYVIMPLARDR